MYQVLDKSTISLEIIPHLSVAKRGFKTKSCLIEIVNSILYKLKTGCQWEFLPVESLFSEVVLHYKTVFGHFRKWSKNGSWKQAWINLLSDNKSYLDLSSASIDGSHTTALRGGEEVAYQGRKKRKTTNALYLADNQGLPLSMSSPVAGNHHDLYQIETSLPELFEPLVKAGILLDGLFVNADSGFDSKVFRETCLREGIFPNVDFNYRNTGNNDAYYILDELLYKERFTIERTNAWMDSFRTILNRFDFTTSSWEAFNYIAFAVILLKKIKQRKKSR
ncbi:IS5 family transposase [Bacteroidales bacterium OttesenSCG-928-M06]|nr:IS5 family transposase [Bacteroidales bacterium OttesenSCG-928-M06]